jgi:hypothetical protein
MQDDGKLAGNRHGCLLSSDAFAKGFPYSATWGRPLDGGAAIFSAIFARIHAAANTLSSRRRFRRDRWCFPSLAPTIHGLVPG